MRNYTELPDLLDAEEVQGYFQEALSDTQAGPEEMTAALFQLAQRQWHSNSPASPGIKSAIEAWLKANWQLDAPRRQINYMLSIVATLKLDGIVPLLEQASSDTSLPESVRASVQAALAEYAEPAEI